MKKISLNLMSAVLFLMMLSNIQANTFPCSYKVYKNTCWKNYEVKVTKVDAQTLKFRESLLLKKGKEVVEKTFKCKPNEPIRFAAEFIPPIWEADKDKKYYTKTVWRVPNSIPEDVTKWQVVLCYPKHFQGIPMPLGYVRDCKCNIPVIKKTKKAPAKPAPKNQKDSKETKKEKKKSPKKE